MRDRRVRLHLEQLGDRVLPSTTTLQPVPVPLPVVPPNPLVLQGTPTAVSQNPHAVFPASPGPTPPPPLPQNQAHPLAGRAQGTFTTTPATTTAGAGYTLQGNAWLNGFGSVTVKGTVRAVGSAATSTAGGQLTITTAQGIITVRLTGGTAQTAFSPLPQWFQYTVTGGTGAYTKFHDQGVLWLGLNPPAPASGQGQFFINLL